MKTLLTVALLGMCVAAGVGRAHAADVKTDGEILGMIMAIDRNEIALAQQAQGKDAGPQVKDYAKMIESEHKANLDKAESLAKKDTIDVPATAGAMLRAEGVKELAVLLPKNGTDYDKDFADAMVKGHTDALELIDNQLSKDATNADVKSLVTETREHVSMHLDKAKALQKT